MQVRYCCLCEHREVISKIEFRDKRKKHNGVAQKKSKERSHEAVLRNDPVRKTNPSKYTFVFSGPLSSDGDVPKNIIAPEKYVSESENTNWKKRRKKRKRKRKDASAGLNVNGINGAIESVSQNTHSKKKVDKCGKKTSSSHLYSFLDSL